MGDGETSPELMDSVYSILNAVTCLGIDNQITTVVFASCPQLSVSRHYLRKVQNPNLLHFFACYSIENAVANYANFTVTGLDDAAVTWATATGNGFDSSVTSVPVANLAMIRVEGTLTEIPVTFAANAAKNGWAMVSYIPEPATATLSLLALPGLAARRRRK